MSHACQRFWKCYKTLTFCSFCQGAQSLAPATRSDIWTSKSAPYPSVFCTFDLEICFAPQRRALFRHLNFQKWSENGVLCTFWLRHVLRATTACTFSTSQLPKVVRGWSALYIFTSKCVRATTACTFSTSQLPKAVRDPGVLYILTCKCASRHNGVQFFISHLASWLRTRRFSEPTFRPSGAQNHWKNTVFRDFPTFLRICIFFLRTLSLLLFFLLIFLFSLPLPCSAFHLSILSEVWLLNFLRQLLQHVTTISAACCWRSSWSFWESFMISLFLATAALPKLCAKMCQATALHFLLVDDAELLALLSGVPGQQSHEACALRQTPEDWVQKWPESIWEGECLIRLHLLDQSRNKPFRSF